MGRVNKKMIWNDPIIPLQVVDYHIMEVKLVGETVTIKSIYHTISPGEADLIIRNIMELKPKTKYYVKAVGRE